MRQGSCHGSVRFKKGFLFICMCTDPSCNPTKTKRFFLRAPKSSPDAVSLSRGTALAADKKNQTTTYRPASHGATNRLLTLGFGTRPEET